MYRQDGVSAMGKNILNIYGLGKLRFSASLASGLAIAAYFVLNSAITSYFILINVTLFGMVLIFSIIELHKQNIDGDPKEIVIDEFLGMYALLLFYNVASPLYHLLLLFAAFRFLDIFKPPPFSWIDGMKTKYAILLDDLAIGIFLGALYKITTGFFI